ADLALAASVAKYRRPFDDDEQLDVWMPVQPGPFPRWCIDKDHARPHAAESLSDEVTRDDIGGQFVLAKECDRHRGRILEEAGDELRLLHQVSRREKLADDALPRPTPELRGMLRICQQCDDGGAEGRQIFRVVDQQAALA